MRAWRTGIRQTDPVRRLVVALTAAVVAFVPAWPSHAATRSGTDVCVIDDPRATELSGLVATPSGYIAVTDSKPNPDDMAIIYLDATCKVTRTLAYPTPARDPEDLAVAPDGALWVADIGDNVTSPTRRETVALWLVPSHEGAPVIHRLTYPDGPHDAEALLFSGDGTPVIVTTEPNGVGRRRVGRAPGRCGPRADAAAVRAAHLAEGGRSGPVGWRRRQCGRPRKPTWGPAARRAARRGDRVPRGRHRSPHRERRGGPDHP